MTDVDRPLGELPTKAQIEGVSGIAGPHRSFGPRAAAVSGEGRTPKRSDAPEQTASPEGHRRCELCDTILKHKRTDARYCSPSHRTEASRQRRLRDGHP